MKISVPLLWGVSLTALLRPGGTRLEIEAIPVSTLLSTISRGTVSTLCSTATAIPESNFELQSSVAKLIVQQSEWIEHSKVQDRLIAELTRKLLQQEHAIRLLQDKVELLETAKAGKPRAAILRTCDQIRRADPSSPSGFYSIDPDGDLSGDPPVTVYCDMSTGATLVSHDSENLTEADRCANPGCYSRTVNYNGTLRQMSALVQQSRNCKQSIQFDCFGVPLELNGIAQAWWNDAQGDAQYYWAGSNSSFHTCQCGIDGNCVDPLFNCNCDSVSFFQLSDFGVITNKSALPITQLNFGRTLSPSTYGRHALGKLECSGREVDDRMPESCEDLWKIGYTLNGFFNVKSGGAMQSVYCDFSKSPGDEGLQTLIGTMDVKSTPVYFHVQRNSTFSADGSNATIPFNIEVVNIGNAMNLSNGTFKAPRPGTYFFAFSGVKSHYSSLYVSLFVNGRQVATTATYGFDFYSLPISLSLMSTLKLEADDVVYLVCSGYYLWEEPDQRYSQFTGILLHEDLN